MAFDLNKVKQAFSAEKMKSLFPRKQTQTPAADASQAPVPAAAAPAPAKQPVSKKKAAIPQIRGWPSGNKVSATLSPYCRKANLSCLPNK